MASFFAEIILRSIYDEEENEFIFHLLEKSIEAVNYNFSKLIFLSFSIKFLAVSGFKKIFLVKYVGSVKTSTTHWWKIYFTVKKIRIKLEM